MKKEALTGRVGGGPGWGRTIFRNDIRHHPAPIVLPSHLFQSLILKQGALTVA